MFDFSVGFGSNQIGASIKRLGGKNSKSASYIGNKSETVDDKI
jgi:hypothetical protein